MFGSLFGSSKKKPAGAEPRSVKSDMQKGVGDYRFVVDMVSIAALIDDRDRQLALGMSFSGANIKDALGGRAYAAVVKVFGEAYADIDPRYVAAFTYLKDAPGKSLDFARSHPLFAEAREHSPDSFKNLIILCAYCSLQINREPGNMQVHDEGLSALAADLYGSAEAADAVLDGLFARSDELMNTPAG
ncbi:MAG: hypothetical protein RLN72_12040 [Henriciella sp.]